MRLCLIAVSGIALLGFGSLQAQQLTVKSAAAKSVDLEWTGALPASSLERSTPAKLPIDGPRSTNPPLDVAIDSKGNVTAVFGS
jgi:hypothetical protein